MEAKIRFFLGKLMRHRASHIAKCDSTNIRKKTRENYHEVSDTCSRRRQLVGEKKGRENGAGCCWKCEHKRLALEQPVDAFQKTIHRERFANIIIDAQHFGICLVTTAFVGRDHDHADRNRSGATQAFQN